jgi:hypothetical protein
MFPIHRFLRNVCGSTIAIITLSASDQLVCLHCRDNAVNHQSMTSSRHLGRCKHAIAYSILFIIQSFIEYAIATVEWKHE